MQHTHHLPQPPNLPPEFQQLRDELVWGIQSLMEHWGLDALAPDEFEDAIASIAEAVYASAMAELFGRYPERIEAFLEESEQALVEGDEMAFIRVLAEHFPDFPEVFAQTAARVVEQTERIMRERLAEELAAVRSFSGGSEREEGSEE